MADRRTALLEDLEQAAPASSTVDPRLAAFVGTVQHRLRAQGFEGGHKGRPISARVDPELLAAASARLGVTSQTDLLNAGLALLAGADTFGGWLLDQAGALDADLEIDV